MRGCFGPPFRCGAGRGESRGRCVAAVAARKQARVSRGWTQESLQGFAKESTRERSDGSNQGNLLERRPRGGAPHVPVHADGGGCLLPWLLQAGPRVPSGEGARPSGPLG